MDSVDPPATAETFGIEYSRLFAEWLGQENVVLVLACSRPAGLLFIGRDAQEAPATHLTPLPELTAIAAAPDGTLWAARRHWLEKYENATRTASLRLGDIELYVPRLRIFTGALDVADLAVDGYGKCLMASRTYSLVGRASHEVSMEPVWHPTFATKIAKETRCGLSGLGLYDAPRHCATVWAKSDRPDGWREDYLQGGYVIALGDNRTMASDLCLPIAPRWDGNDLYLVSAGSGELGKVDLETGRFEPICLCPGYPTGLAVHGQWAVVTVSSAPCEKLVGLDLPVARRFANQGIEPMAGVLLVDLRTGDIAHNARMVDPRSRVEGVAIVSSCRQALALAGDDCHLDSLVTFRLA